MLKLTVFQHCVKFRNKSTDGQVMATGEVIEERKIRYTFKEYVKDKKI